MTVADDDRLAAGRAILKLLPGIGLCFLVASTAYALGYIETEIFGRAWLGTVVFSILLGLAMRGMLNPSAKFTPGVSFCAKTLLEIGVFLMGATVSAKAVLSVNGWLIAGVAGMVIASSFLSYLIGRCLGLSTPLSIMIACGNAICGNSAVVAVAPIVKATSGDVAVAIAFTAILGIGVVLSLPLIGIFLGLEEVAYGALAGLVVYAVPQVVAASAPIGSLALQVGVLVKLVRVLMLAPMCAMISLVYIARTHSGRVRGSPVFWRGKLFIPWFIVGFSSLLTFRWLGILPEPLVSTIATASGTLTMVAMAALGLTVQMKDVRNASWRAVATVSLSLLGLVMMSLCLLRALSLA